MGDVGKFRPIAPRTAPPSGGAGSPQPPNGNGGASDDARMKRASTACKECQKRRTRCSMSPTSSSCTECETHGRECLYDESSDKRRKASAKRTQEDLSNLREFVEQLLQLLRVGDNNTVQHLIHQIRSGATQEDICGIVFQYFAQTGQLNRNMMNNTGNYYDDQ